MVWRALKVVFANPMVIPDTLVVVAGPPDQRLVEGERKPQAADERGI